MAERSKATDCKSVGNTHVGSNPTPLTMNDTRFTFRQKSLKLKKFHPPFTPASKLKRPRPDRTRPRVFFIGNVSFYNLWSYLTEHPLGESSGLTPPPSLERNLGTYSSLSGIGGGRFTSVRTLPLVYLLFSYGRLYRSTGLYFLGQTNGVFRQNYKLLMLNFRRFRFFPSLQSESRRVYTSLSLGLFLRFFKKGKSFIKSKSNFLVLAGFLRKILLFTSITDLILIVRKTPIYLTEILHTLNTPVITPYENPLTLANVDEVLLRKYFYFLFFVFIGSKPYGFLKTRKRGRVKRKITKRIVKLNSVVD
jgi:hypothetical protein